MRTLRVIHRWLGILLALPLLVQGLSGAVLTLEPVWPHWGSSAATGGIASANAILAAASAVAPDGMRPSRYVPPEQSGDPVKVYLATPGGPRGQGLVVRVDAVTATVLGPPEPATGVIETLKRLHENWLIPQWGGRQVVGWIGVGLLVLTLLGIPLWWPRQGEWRDGFTVPRRASGARLQRRLHGAVGAWMVAMLLATSITGIVEGFPQTSRALLGLPAGGPPRPGRPERGAAPPPDLDAAIRLATAAAPGTALRGAMLPAGPEPIRLFMGPPGTEGALTNTVVTVDGPATRVLSVQSGPTGGDYVLRLAHDLHFGQGFGPVWRGLTVLVGLSLPVFGVTGVLLWWLKRRNRRRVAVQRDAAVQA